MTAPDPGNMTRPERFRAAASHAAEATCATMRRAHWTHYLILAAVREGANATIVSRIARERAGLWYRTGEPVWMAAISLHEMAMAQDDHSPAAHLHEAMQACECVLARA